MDCFLQQFVLHLISSLDRLPHGNYIEEFVLHFTILSHLTSYRCLIGRLLYLNTTRPNIAHLLPNDSVNHGTTNKSLLQIKLQCVCYYILKILQVKAYFLLAILNCMSYQDLPMMAGFVALTPINQSMVIVSLLVLLENRSNKLLCLVLPLRLSIMPQLFTCFVIFPNSSSLMCYIVIVKVTTSDFCPTSLDLDVEHELNLSHSKFKTSPNTSTVTSEINFNVYYSKQCIFIIFLYVK